MNREAMIATVQQFYAKALTVNAETTPSEVLGRVLADDFVSVNAQETKPKEALIKQIGGFWKLVPDLRWDIQEVLVDGAQVVVRSLASGTPAGDFFGRTTNGTRRFQIDTIDIHQLRDGRITRVYHLEDWATAMRQLG